MMLHSQSFGPLSSVYIYVYIFIFFSADRVCFPAALLPVELLLDSVRLMALRMAGLLAQLPGLGQPLL